MENTGVNESVPIQEEVVYDTNVVGSYEEIIRNWEAGKKLLIKAAAKVYKQTESELNPGSDTGNWEEVLDETGRVKTIPRGTEVEYTGTYKNNENPLSGQVITYVEVKYEEVVSLEKNEDIFILKTSLDNVYYAKNVILALGSNPRKLNLPNEDQFTGRGISYCAMCDGNFYKDKEILVYGGGNSAISEALFLTNIVKKLTIVSRSNLRADKSLVEELSSKQNVDILENKLIDSLIIDNNEIKGVKLKDKFNNEITSLNIEGIFVYIGAIPSTGFLTNLGILNKEGYIEVNNHFETKINNLYAIGDVINKDLRQIVTATNDGAFAIHYVLEKLKK